VEQRELVLMLEEREEAEEATRLHLVNALVESGEREVGDLQSDVVTSGEVVAIGSRQGRGGDSSGEGGTVIGGINHVAGAVLAERGQGRVHSAAG
jgi:hypothetical protein